MRNQKGQGLSKFFIVLLLLGIFIELLVLIGIFKEHREGNIAVVEVAGPIEESLPTIKELKNFEKNQKVKAIVLRVNSPGGTVGASQEIHDEIIRINKVKPVVVSMSDIAASGGYYISAGASKIVANPGTITGSLGVIATYFVVDDLLKKLHLKWEVIKAGESKDIASPLKPLSEKERAILQNMSKDIHEQFIQAVSQGRKLDIEKVKSLADGSVFSGRQAQGLGLVDELGSLEHAILVAAKLSKLEEKPDPIYPKEDNVPFFGHLRGALSNIKTLSVRLQ